MKTQIEINDQLWNDFKAKVQADGKTLREVVPTVFEPALRAFLDPKLGIATVFRSDHPEPPPEPSDAPQVKPTPPKAIPVPTVKRCELCDMPTERRFNLKGRKVCYTCWRDGIIAEAVPEPPVSNTSRSEGPSPYSVSGGAS